MRRCSLPWLIGLVAGCHASPAEPPAPSLVVAALPPSSSSTGPARESHASAQPSGSALALASASGATSAEAPSPAPAPSALPSSTPAISRAEAEQVLFPDGITEPARACSAEVAERDQIRCLIDARWPALSAPAVKALYDDLGSLLGVEEAGEMNGGYRGRIKLVPELPVGVHASHLGWVTGALREHDGFFERLGPAGGSYRHKPIVIRFFRSVGKRTPAAYASGWEVAYNVSGSINTSAEVVSETLFHEIFHLNDQAHDGWSGRALSDLYQRIVRRCGERTACLAPYAPHTTQVRGGTYYAFHKDNGVGEYAAELAVRYFREQREAMNGRPPRAPFKCGPSENREAWALFVAEFFAGRDLVPGCP